ncbi:hypothetical protein FE257_008888 [Aspergillus nanangensis]|uniref:Mid2 domain-containing protein n=1 Tax=Aspergillus nanangensis TaxID=2582783 RepID=A0AAD4CWU1_ASPNN|nr:hypothetical protein FE257_008888 [Aspergillus nanangensis]
MCKFLSIILLGLILTTAAKNPGNYFMNPASNTGINPEWEVGDEQVVSWKTTTGAFNISLWQQSLVEQAAISQVNIFTKIHASDKINNFTWVVQTYAYDLDYSNVFFLWINADKPDGFISSYFNITSPSSPPPSKTTNATVSATPSATDLPDPKNPTTSSSPSTTEAANSSSTDSASTGLTTTSKIALGVGIGGGVLVLSALAVLIWLRYRTGRAMAAAAAAARERPYPTSSVSNDIIPRFFPPTEMDGGKIPTHYYPELSSQQHH